MNSTPRSQAHRKARRDAGLVPVTMWVPKELASHIRRFVNERTAAFNSAPASVRADIVSLAAVIDALPQPPHDKHGEVK